MSTPNQGRVGLLVLATHGDGTTGLQKGATEVGTLGELRQEHLGVLLGRKPGAFGVLFGRELLVGE